MDFFGPSTSPFLLLLGDTATSSSRSSLLTDSDSLSRRSSSELCRLNFFPSVSFLLLVFEGCKRT